MLELATKTTQIDNRIISLRKFYKLSRHEFAVLSNLGKATLYKYEYGLAKNIHEGVLVKISATFGTTKKWLLTGEGEMLPNGPVQLPSVASVESLWKYEAFLQLELRAKNVEQENKHLWQLIENMELNTNANSNVSFSIKPTRLEIKLKIRRSAKEVYKVFSSALGTNQWFTSEAQFLEFGNKPRKDYITIDTNDVFSWNFYEEGIGRITGEVLLNIKKDFLKFSFKHNTVFSVLISGQQQITELELVHEGFKLNDSLHLELYNNWNRKWSFYLANLRSVLEFNNDLRWKTNDSLP